MIFTGCGEGSNNNDTPKDNIQSNATTSTPSTRFVTTKDTYTINGDDYTIVVDNETDNVYLSAKRNYGNNTFLLADKDGKLTKYKDLKK
jgi:hypothetical protein